MNRELLGLALLAGASVTAALLMSRGDPICPETCPGDSCQAVGDFCLVMTGSKPARYLGEDLVSNVADIYESERMRLVGCCQEVDGQQVEVVRWQPVTQPLGGCLQIVAPGLFSGISMSNVDVGNVDALNMACCGANKTMVTPGHWGNCPRCAFRCQAGQALPNPGGCDSYCMEVK